MSGLETKSYPATMRSSKLACAVIPVSITATTEPAPAEPDTEPAFTPNSPANAVLSRDITRAVAEFDPELDYVLPSGSSLSTGLFLVGLFARGIRKIKVLMWSGNDQNYHGGVLDLNTALEAQNV